MPQQFLHSADIITPFQEMGCEGMPQDVTTHLFGQSHLDGRLLHSPLQDVFVDMMPTHRSASGVH